MQVSYDDVVRWIRAFAAEIGTNKEQLTELDSAIGDGDHGINMDRGMSAVIGKVDTADQDQDIGARKFPEWRSTVLDCRGVRGGH